MTIRRSLAWVLLYVAAWAAASGSVDAADLHADTVTAFDRYVRLTEARLDEERRGTLPFLWIETLGNTQRQNADTALRRGEVIVGRLETRDAGRPIDIPGGQYHYWIGTIFVPGVTLDRIAALMQAYDRYHEIYRPSVRQSRVLARDGDRFTVSLQLFTKKVISVVLNTDYDVRYLRLAPTRMHVRSVTTRIAEVQRPDTADERERPVGHDNGFLWRFNNYCALEERGSGTYVQCESVSLSRTIPTGLGWLIGPFVTSIPKESLEFTLRAMRGALATR